MPPKKNPVGRPRVDAIPITMRVPPDEMAALDAWIAKQPPPTPTRQEAFRELVRRITMRREGKI